jgi:competence protein ComEC
LRRRPLSVAFLLLIAFIVIIKLSGLCLWQSLFLPEDMINDIKSGREYHISGTITKRAEKQNSYLYILSDSVISDGEGNSHSLQNIQLYFPKTESLIKIGSIIRVYGNPELFENASNPGGFNQADYYASQNSFASMYIEEYDLLEEPDFSFGEALENIKSVIKETIEKNMSEGSAAVLCAMLLGDKTDLGDDLKSDYSASGLSHILAVSGLHVSIVGLSIYKVLIKLRIGIIPGSITASIASCFYCAFTGGSESAMRATIMFVVMLTAKCLLRNYDSINALSLAGIIILLIRPLSLFNAGFQLSFSAAFGAGSLYPVLLRKLNIKKKEGVFNDLLYRIKTGALIWVSVNITTLPFLLYNFSQFPVYSVISNIIFVPMAFAIMMMGIAGITACLLLPLLGQAILFIPDVLIKSQILFGELTRKLPFAMLTTGKPHNWQFMLSLLGIALFIFLINRKKSDIRLMAGSLVFSTVVLLHIPEGFKITFLDVGQGDGIVINTDDNKTFIVDAGSSSENDPGKYILEPYLKSSGITYIEGIMLTHMDEDHVNGVQELFEMIADNKIYVSVKNLILPVNLKNDSEADNIKKLAKEIGAEVIYVKQGDVIRSSETVFNILLPKKREDADEYLEGNEGSMVVSVEYDGFSALLTGDIEGKGEEELTETAGQYDIIKAAHHGSKNSTSDEFLEKTSPKIAVISAPEKSVYGHPHSETIQRLEEHGVEYFQTGINGAISISVKNGSCKVNAEKSVVS